MDVCILFCTTLLLKLARSVCTCTKHTGELVASAYANWFLLLKAYGTWLVQVMIVRFLFIHYITGALGSQRWQCLREHAFANAS